MITDKVTLLGGGRILIKFARRLRKYKVYTDARHEPELKISNIPYVCIKDVNNIRADGIGISCSAVWIFKNDLIKKFDKLYNIHAQRLPLFKGAGGITWNILSNDYRGGITIHEITEGIDNGNIVLQEKFTYPKCCKIPKDFYDYMAPYEDKIIDKFIKGNFRNIKQGKGTYFPRVSTINEAFIDWSWTQDEICTFINAFDEPYEGASAFYNGNIVHLKKCRKEKGSFHPFQSGLIYHIDKGLHIAARGGGIVIGETSPVAKFKVGKRFITPYEYLRHK